MGLILAGGLLSASIVSILALTQARRRDRRHLAKLMEANAALECRMRDRTTELQHLADDLAASERRLRRYLDQAPIGLSILSRRRDGQHVYYYLNLACAEIYEQPVHRLLGRTVGEVWPPRVAAEIEHRLGSFTADGARFEDVLRHEVSGRLKYLDGTMIALDGDAAATRQVLVCLRDVTRKRELEDELQVQISALRKSEAFLERVGQLAGIGGWELDLATFKPEFSDETARIHGLPARPSLTVDEAIGFYAPSARPVIRAAVERAAADGQGWDLELPFVTAAGRQTWVRTAGSAVLVDGTPVRLIGLFQDIGDAVRRRAELQAANERLTLATDSGGIGIWDWDVVQDRLVWDDWMYRLYGTDRSSGEEAYSLWRRHLHPDDAAAGELATRRALAGEAAFDIEFRVVWQDGSVHYIKAHAQVIRDASGTPLRMVGTNWDVTEKRKLIDALAEQHELLEVTLQSIGDGVITADARACVTWLNPVAERMTGWTAASAVGQPLDHVFRILHGETRLPAENPFARCVSEGEVIGLAADTVLVSRDGQEYGIQESASPLRNRQGELLGMVLVFHDVTEQRRLSGEMSYRACHDALTGLLNRAEFEQRLRRLLHACQADGSEHALMYIDLDQFKVVNDTCGHTAGDELLQQVTRLLTSTVRGSDTLARLGGDEFAVILEHCGLEHAERLAQRICETAEAYRFVHDDRRFRIGTSIGLVPVDRRWATPAAVLQAADTSCYAAKEAGRNRVHVWFDDDQAMRARDGETQWVTRLEQALDEDRFTLFAQRIEPLQAGAPGLEHDRGLHAEVLLRMVDLDGALVPPGAFLPAAERFHLASRVDRWVLDHAIRWMQARAAQEAVAMLCVNLSGQSVGDRAFHRWAIEMLEAAGPDICRRLCLEITETAAVTNLADAAVFIARARSIHVRVALDDFGAGASSFGYLKNLAVDFLKIDGQFTRGLVTDPLDAAAVRCFADVAKAVGIATVAEFVDSAPVLQRLQSMGVDFAQGFLLHRPAPIAELFPATAPATAGAGV